jgi:hypothetical protein
MSGNDDLDRLQRSWTPPAELATAVPRETRLAGGGIAISGLAVLMLLAAVAVGVGLSLKIKRQEANRTQLRDSGVVTEGVVTRHWRNNDKESTPMIAYDFDDKRQRQHGSSTAPRGVWNGLDVGSRLAVRFVPGNSSLNHPAEWDPETLPKWAPLLFAAILTTPAVILLSLARRQARLLSYGTPAPALITGYRNVKGGKALVYEFATSTGERVKGRGGDMRNPPPVGSIVCILYDPERPARNSPYPMPLTRVAAQR